MDEKYNLSGDVPEHNTAVENANYDSGNDAEESNNNTDNSRCDQSDTEHQTSAADGNELTCSNCGGTPVVQGYSLPLCAKCRDYFTKYPVPGSIKIFALALLVIFIISMLFFPKSLKAGIAYERGLRAENEKKYITAANEYQKAVDIFPNSFIACGKLFVAHVKNYNFEQADAVFAMIEDKESNDSDEVKVIDEANEAIDFLNDYFNISDELMLMMQNNESLDTNCEALRDYTIQNPDDFWGHYLYAQALFDLTQYESAKAEYLKAVELKPEIHEFRLGAAAAFRQTGEFDKAIEQCNIVLSENAEFPEAFVSLSKIDLKRKRYSDALKNAEKAFGYDNTNPNTIATLALAYHYNNMDSQCDELMDTLRDYDDYYYEYARDIINGESDLFN